MHVGSYEAYAKNFKTRVDLKNINIAPIIKDGRTLVPLRFIAEKFGAVVEWDAADSKIAIKSKNKNIKFVLNDNKYTVNGQEANVDVPAQLINDRTYLPLRTVTEALNKKLLWDHKGIIILGNTDEDINNVNSRLMMDQIFKLFKVIASDSDRENVPSNVLDGNVTTRWASLGSGHWIRFDLQESRKIRAVGISFTKANERVAKFDVEVSEDALSWKKVFSGTSNVTTDMIEKFDIQGAAGRYVKIVGQGNSQSEWNSYNEIKIYSADGKEIY